MHSNSFPLGRSLTLEQLAGDLYPQLHRLRAAEPIAWVPAIDAWLVTRWDLAVEIMRDARTFTVDHPGFSTAQVVGPSMLSLDGKAHQRHRQPFERPFRKRAVVDRFTSPVQHTIAGLLNDLRPQGSAELRRAFAGPVAVQAMMLALGLQQLPVATVLNWYDTIVAAVTAVSAGEPVSAAGREAFERLRDHLLPALDADPDSSLLAAAGQDAADLTPAEIVSNTAVLLFGGIETTEGMIANALFHLLTHPAALAQVTQEPTLIAAAVEESLRLEPAAAVVDRYAVHDVELAGASIRTGDLVRVSLLGANRDPAVFPNPDVFDLTRPNLRSHVTFVQGPHVCLGLHLARLECELAVGAALRGLPGLELVAPEKARPTGLIFRKPADLAAQWQVAE